MKTKESDNDLKRIKDEIRTDADAANRRAPAAAKTKNHAVSSSVRAYDTSRNAYSLDELGRFHFTTFVDHAYRVLLKRPPDAHGFDGNLRILTAGYSKIEILGNLRYSAEGRAVGVRVPGLLPRYMLTKLYHIPVLGYLLEWAVCWVGLPMIVRHQRGADTFHTARSYEVDTARRELAASVDMLSKENKQLRDQFESITHRMATMRADGERVAALRGELERVCGEAIELRHLVLSMNHWLASLRQNLAALELADAEQSRKSDISLAEMAMRVLGADASRTAALIRWADLLAAALPRPARVLDLCSGDDWLELLLGRGIEAAGVDTNFEIAKSAQAAGRDMTAADPSAVLARTADGTLDGLTVVAADSLLRGLPMMRLLDAARRVLRPNGVLLVGFASAPASIANRLEGRAASDIDKNLLAVALANAGFVAIENVALQGDEACLLARNPQ